MFFQLILVLPVDFFAFESGLELSQGKEVFFRGVCFKLNRVTWNPWPTDSEVQYSPIDHCGLVIEIENDSWLAIG